MKLRFRILSGSLKGHFATAKAGTILGRSPGTLQLDDPKVSGKHAVVERSPTSKKLILKDLGSTNGLRLDGKKVTRIELAPGVVFEIGKTKIRVEAPSTKKALEDESKPPKLQEKLQKKIEKKTEEKPPEMTVSQPPGLDPRDMEPTVPRIDAPEEVPPPLETSNGGDTGSSVAEIDIAPQNWSEFFSDFCAENMDLFEDKPIPLEPFEELLHLECIRGLQIDHRWTLGYGPRMVGADSLDFPLYDPASPGTAFILVPSPEGPLLKTTHKNLIRVNGKAISSEVLRAGDLIQLGETVWRVDIHD